MGRARGAWLGMGDRPARHDGGVQADARTGIQVARRRLQREGGIGGIG